MSRFEPVMSYKIREGLGTTCQGEVVFQDAELVKIAQESIGFDATGAVGPAQDPGEKIIALLNAVPEDSWPKLLADLISIAELKARDKGHALRADYLDDCKAMLKIGANGNPAPRTVRQNVYQVINGTQDAVSWRPPRQFTAVNKTFHELLLRSVDTYVIPPYQRRFSWDAYQLEQLWSDLCHMRARKEPHFLGFAMIMPSNGNGKRMILDGQQRFASVLLIVIAAIARLRQLVELGSEPSENESRMNYLAQVLLAPRGHDAEAEHRLEMGRLDRSQFFLMLERQGAEPVEPHNPMLAGAYEFFLQEMRAHDNGVDIRQLVDDVLHGFYICEIELANIGMAHSLFDTLNNRGTRLSGADLVKNFMIGIADPDGMGDGDDLAKDWDAVVTGLGAHDMDEYVKALLIAHGVPVGASNTLDMVKATIKGRRAANELLSDLNSALPLYLAHLEPAEKYWLARFSGNKSVYDDMQALVTLGSRSHLGLSLVAIKKLSAADYIEFVGLLVVMAVRHRVVHGNVDGRLGKFYEEMAANWSRADMGLKDLQRAFVRVCPSDEIFAHKFKFLEVPTRNGTKEALYYLEKLETQANGNRHPPASLTIEHVFPQNPTPEWRSAFGANGGDDYKNRLGNFALLYASDNRKLDQGDAATKFAFFRTTSIRINHKIAEQETWTYKNLERHQGYLARLAKTVWQMPHVDG